MLKIHTNANPFQLGALFSQKVKPIAFYSRRLTDAQKRYKFIERELISIIKTLKEFITILLGQKIRIYTNHKNFTCKNFNTERILIWRLILEEYGPDIKYIKGEKNILADALSRFTLNMNHKTTHKYTYQKEIVSEINDIEELPEGTFTINYKVTSQYQQTKPSLMA